MRKGIFHEMLEFVNHHNELYRQGKVTFKVGINKFADMVWINEMISNKYEDNVKVGLRNESE